MTHVSMRCAFVTLCHGIAYACHSGVAATPVTACGPDLLAQQRRQIRRIVQVG
jgi:hypothetical protein